MIDRTGLCIVTLLASGLALIAPAQQPAPSAQPTRPAAPPAPVATPAPDREPRSFTARELVRLAVLDLRAANPPTPLDFAGAQVLLGLAHELDPQNPDIIRRQIEAAHSAGDENAVLEYTRALILLDPSDTVALLRLVSATISRDHQTAESRLAAYDRFIADERLDAAIRSRLALDAALLLRERGDDAGFRSRLIRSMQLDPTHKEAATLAATVYADRVANDPAGRIDLLVNLLKADPVDPNVHMSIARELASQGAYKGAHRFHSNALSIGSILGSVPDTAMVENRVLSWYTNGPASVVKELNDTIASERDAAARMLRELIQAKRPTDGVPKPEEINLPAPAIALYILAADAAGDRPAVQGGVKDLTAHIERLVEQLRNPRTRGDMSDEAAAATAVEALIQLNTIRFWMDIDVDKVHQNPDFLRTVRQAFPNAAIVLDGFAALRAGKPQEALDLCSQIDNRMGRIATALSYEALGHKEEAVAAYRALSKEDPLAPACAWGQAKARGLSGQEPNPGADKLERRVADPQIPQWMDRMAGEPHRFVRITASVPGNETDATELFPLKITITNQSPIPLALGPDRTLCSRFVLVPKLEQLQLGELLRPEVIDVDRRLRLLPRETLEVEVWPTHGQCGWVMDCLANRSIRARWRLIQGFLADFKSGFRPGPMSVISETDAFLVLPLAASALSPEELAATISTAPLDTLRRLACVTRALALQPALQPSPVAPDLGLASPAPSSIQDLTPVASAFANRYPSLSPAMRAMLAAVLPHQRLAPEMAAFDAVVRSDEDPMVRCIALCTRVADPADELLKSAATAGDPRITQTAEAVAQRLTTDAKVYARLTPDTFKPGSGEGAAGAAK